MTLDEMLAHPIMSKVLDVFESECDKVKKEDVTFTLILSNGNKIAYKAKDKGIDTDKRDIPNYVFKGEASLDKDKDLYNKMVNSLEISLYNKVVFSKRFEPPILINEKAKLDLEYRIRL
jgi:hypothetical protein